MTLFFEYAIIDTCQGGFYMKSIDGPSIPKTKRIMGLILLSLLMMITCYSFHSYSTYKSINVKVSNTAVIEYGSANYDLGKLITDVDGEVVSVKKDVDTNKLGEQEVILEVQKNNIVKEVPIVVSVVDTAAPVITLKNETMTITQGDSYSLIDNIESVSDLIDGNLDYLESAEDGRSKYYSISYSDDINSVGVHEIVINAIDNSGNKSTQKFTLEVVEPEPVIKHSEPVFENVDPSVYGGDLTSIAYSLVGRPYISGGSGPYGFDCSGFVQYVYSLVGVNVSRSSSTQLYDGVGVSYENAQPGDIVLWGYNGVVTHSSLYVGNGTMIHAANPGTGVIVSNIAGWLRGSGTQIVSVRRIN